MSKTNNIVLKVLQIVAWIIFIGLSIEAGSLIINFIFSLFKPEMVGDLYRKLDLRELYYQSKLAFFGLYSFALIIAMLKAGLFYTVIKLILKLNLSKPFNHFVSKQITKISFQTLVIGILSQIARQLTKNLQNHGYVVDDLNQLWVDSQAYVLMAAVIYVIATIFKKGIELQNEIDLTV